MFSYKNPAKGSNYLWPSFENGKHNQYAFVDELVMWSSRYSYDYHYDVPIVVTLPTDLAAWDIVIRCTICPVDTAKDPTENEEINGSVGIRTFQPIVSSTCHKVSSGCYDGLGEWIYYPARNGSLEHLSSFLETQKTFWHGLTEETFKLASPVWMAAPDDPESLVVVLLSYNDGSDGSGNGLEYTLVSCSISSYWWLTDASLEFVSKPLRFRLEVKAPPLAPSGALAKTSDMRRITFDLTNMEFLRSIEFTVNVLYNTPAALPMYWISVLGALPLSWSVSHLRSSDATEMQSPPTVRSIFYSRKYALWFRIRIHRHPIKARLGGDHSLLPHKLPLHRVYHNHRPHLDCLGLSNGTHSPRAPIQRARWSGSRFRWLRLHGYLPQNRRHQG